MQAEIFLCIYPILDVHPPAPGSSGLPYGVAGTDWEEQAGATTAATGDLGDHDVARLGQERG